MNSQKKYCLGIMSGTSLDGVDICYARFDHNSAYNYEILKAVTYKYPDTWKLALQNAFNADEKSLINLDNPYFSLIVFIN